MVRKVEEVSRLSGISKRTLQYYDDEGILPAKRSKENYRLYDEVAMEKLWEILWYKEMGVQLSEIKEILVMPKKEREEYFEQKVKSIGEKIQDLEEQRKFVRHIEKYYLQLDPLRDVIEQPINDLLDINGWDLQKALRLMYKSNPTLFEWLKSPIIYIETEFADEMRRVMSDYFSVKHSLYHYISMAEGNYKKYLRTEMVKAKKYFYVLRPLLAGQWILEKESPPPMLFSELVEAELPDEVRTEVEDLLKIKIHEPEIKKIPRVNRLNEYLESEIAGLREKAGKLGEEKR